MSAGGGPARRAPRLGPDERLASYVTRRGRFRKVDPRRGRPLPAVTHWVAAAGWAVFLLQSFRRARAQIRKEPGREEQGPPGPMTSAGPSV